MELALWAAGPDWLRPLLLLGVAGVLAMAVLHLRLLVWNLTHYRRWRRSEAFQRLRAGNKDVALMTLPLTLTMTINVCSWWAR